MVDWCVKSPAALWIIKVASCHIAFHGDILVMI